MQNSILQAGLFKGQEGVRTESIGTYEIVYVTCRFEKSKADIKCVFDKTGRICGLWFIPIYEAPAYARLSAFREKDVVVGSGKWLLPGTLTIPTGKGPFPALILVHGSGPNDRDETIGPNKPFCDLAWGLSSHGIVVLRYDKRTKVYQQKLGLQRDITVKEETIDDVLSAVTLLTKTKDVDCRRVFVLGHSLGGTLIPRIGKSDSRIAGFIVMAGATSAL